jgi:hypothetical protein
LFDAALDEISSFLNLVTTIYDYEKMENIHAWTEEIRVFPDNETKYLKAVSSFLHICLFVCFYLLYCLHIYFVLEKTFASYSLVSFDGGSILNFFANHGYWLALDGWPKKQSSAICHPSSARGLATSNFLSL